MRTEHTLSDLSSLGLLKITGENAKKFLQGQLTCNLDEVTASQSRLGAHCNPQGRIISLFRIFLYQDSYYLQMPKENWVLAHAALKKYAVFFKVDLTDASETLPRIGYCGSELKNIIPSLPENDNDMVITDHFSIIKIQGVSPRYEILGNVTLSKEKLTSQTNNIWQYLDITSGIPNIYPETSEKFLPHEINLPTLNAVSFNKGCFTGQEIIARMQYRGKLKTHLYQAKAESNTAPIRGGAIYSGKDACGSIVDYCQVSYNSYELLIIASEKDIETTLALDPENAQQLEIKR